MFYDYDYGYDYEIEDDCDLALSSLEKPVENVKEFKLKCIEFELWVSNVLNSNNFIYKSSFTFDLKNKITCSLEINKEYNRNTSTMIVTFDKEITFNDLEALLILKKNKSMCINVELKVNHANPMKYYGNVEEIHLLSEWIIIRFAYSLANCSDINFWSKAVENLLGNDTLSDFTITSSDNVKFQVNKFVLYHKSDVFKKAIEFDMVEKKNNNINICFDSVIVKELINYMHIGKCDFQVGVQELFRSAHLYALNDLLRDCEDYMLNNLRIEDVTDTLRLVNIDSYDLSALKIEVEKFIKSNEIKLVENAKFIEYSLENMKPENIHVNFELAMKYNNEDFKANVKNYIKNNYKNCVSNALFRELLISNPIWAVDYLDYLTEFV